MRDGPLYFAALVAIGLGIWWWDRRRSREHVDMFETLRLDDSDAPEHEVAHQFVVINRNHRGHVIYCEKCRRYLLSGKTLNHDDATKRARWHVEAHYMEAV